MSIAMNQVEIDKIQVLPQVRTVYDNDKLMELAESIKERGILEPLIVRENGEGGYVLVAGQRRLLAAKEAKLGSVPVIVNNELKIDEVAFVQLVENLQREDLNDMDLALTFTKLMTDDDKLTAEKLGKKVGKSEAFVAQRLRLLKAAPEVQEALRIGDIDFGGARALCGLKKAEQPEALGEAIDEEKEARKKRAEKRGAKTDLEGAPTLPGTEEEESEDDEGEGETKAKKGKKKKEPKKATAKTVRRVARRKKAETKGRQGKLAPVEERLTERAKEWVAGFVDEDTKGQGLEDPMSSAKVRNLLGRFLKYLLEQKALIVR